jgi:hypothetical protein
MININQWIISVGDGNINMSQYPNSITMKSGNNSKPSYTTLTTIMSQKGILSFNYNTTTVDWSNYYDPLSYSINGIQVFLANSSTKIAESGYVNINVDKGDIYKFIVYTTDGVYGSSTSIITNLTFTPSNVSTITTNPIASEITYGQALSNSILSGGVGSVAGSFAFTNPNLVLNAGTQSVSVTFTPDNVLDYNTLTFNVNIIVNKATPLIITSPTCLSIQYGQSLLSSFLSGGVGSVVGSFTFTNPNLILPVGNNLVDVTFTPENLTNYNIVIITINILVTSTIPSLFLPPKLILLPNIKQNIYVLNPQLNNSDYKFYSSDNKIGTIDGLGNIEGKLPGQFHIIVTDLNGIIIFRSNNITVLKPPRGSGGVPNF